ncbi:MAG: outer membrane protein assembly factor BamA [Phycisphaerales bacterium]|nr:outer membrane protein assembly factor BamA [Phycisphaerales bacterium]
MTRAACLLIALAGLPQAALAQDNTLTPAPTDLSQPEGPYDGRYIASVTILIAEPGTNDYQPADNATGQLIRNQIRTGKGSREYSQQIVADDIARLNRLGRFSRVEHLLAFRDNGSVDVTFRLERQPIIADVQVAGNRRISTARIAKEVDFLAGTPVDQFELDRAARAIEDLYRDKGFHLAGVTVNLDELKDTGVVLFEVREGLRTRITDIRFEGNTSFRPGLLLGEIETRESNIFRSGPLDDNVLRADERALARYYKDHGYLDARAGSLVTTSPDSREAIVTFYIEEGPLYSLRSVVARYSDINGAPVLSEEQIIGLIEMKPGDTYSDIKVQKAIDLITDAYGQLGYVDANVQKQEVRDPTRPLVDIVLGIRQGERFRTGIVQITGNGTTRHEEIRKHAQVAPGRPLDKTAVDRTAGILTASRLFEITQSPPRTAILQPDKGDPEYRDVLIEVTETNTGSLGFGAAVNSDAGLVGQLSFTQRNFDITDTPDSVGDLFSGKSFRGGGQTFNIAIQPGTTTGNYAISLGDNSINDSSIGGSISGYLRTRDFNEYNEARRGINAALTRRFGERWRGSIDLRYQAIKITDIEASSTTDVFESEGENLLSGLGFGLRRTTVPPQEAFRPTRGSITEVSVEQVGALGGDYDFTRLSGDHTVFLSLNEDYLGTNTVLRLSTRTAYIPQGQGDVPTFERYYLGGKSFRGFDFRTVGPRGVRNDNNQPSPDPIGGTWSFFWGAELQQPILGEGLAIAFFLDTGTVNEEFSFDNYRVSVGTGLRLYVPQLSPAPLAFDFGFPILSEDTDEDRLFTFDIDLPI